jgi:hypothetical protein
MKFITRLLLLLPILIYFNYSYSQGFLKASGKQIVNEKNENVLLRGIGLGGWMLQEGYMLRLQGINPQYSIRKRIEQLTGIEKTQEFYDAWLSNFVTKADIDSLHKWGFNSVRLPMHYNLFTLPAEQEPDPDKQTWLTKGFALTDSLLKWCKANNMYRILDLHAAPGGQGNDLLNEPNWGFDDTLNDKHGLKEEHNKPLRELLMNITLAIRSVDKKHIIIIEGNGWGNNYKGMLPTWDNNMFLSFHKYWSENDVKSIQHILDTRDKYNVPVWLGETGENSNTWFTDAVQLYEENNIGWSWWPLKKLGNNNPLQVKSNANYIHLADYWNGKAANPPNENDAYNGLMEFANSTNIRSNIVHRDVLDALFRQPFSNATIPFKSNIVSSKDSIINAVDYDLGKNNFAYFDKDTGNYYISRGGRNAGNRGNTYRNDGVDIYKINGPGESYYVGSIEDSEWIQYTIDVKEAAPYNLNLNVAAESAGIVSITMDNKTVIDKKDITSTGSFSQWQTQALGSVQLSKGQHVVRVYFDKGGFYLKEIIFNK